jgi:hypothetical protein
MNILTHSKGRVERLHDSIICLIALMNYGPYNFNVVKVSNVLVVEIFHGAPFD